MAVILAESVAITKSRLTKGFNGDNLNLNGKVISAEEADNGFKAAGSVKPPYISVVASGNQKGFASGAATAFNDYVKDVNFNKYNSESVLNRYYDDMDAVVEKCGIENGRLSMGIVCAYDDCVVASKTGGCHILRFSDGELFEIALSEEEKGRGFQFVDTIADGDIFALLGEEVSDNLDYDAIVNVFDSGNDLKSMARDLFKLLAKAAGKDCTLVLVKLKSDTERTYAAIPDVSFTDDIIDGGEGIPETPDQFETQPAIDESELKENDPVITDEDIPETTEKNSTKKKILGFIPVVILVIILAVAAALYFATHPLNFNKPASSPTTDSTDAVLEMLTDETEDFNGSTGMEEMEDTEYGGNVGDAQGVIASTSVPETTTREETTTRRQVTTTRAPSTTAATTEATTAATTEATTAATTEATTQAPVENTTQAPAPEITPEPIAEEPAGQIVE